MRTKTRGIRFPQFLQTSIIAVLIYVLVFPSSMLAGSAAWNGGTGNYTSPENWTCPDCGVSGYPDGPHDVTIDGGSAQLDVIANINYLNIGYSGQLDIVPGGQMGVGSISSGTIISNGGVINATGGILSLSGIPGETLGIGGSGAIYLSSGGTLSTNVNLLLEHSLSLESASNLYSYGSLENRFQLQANGSVIQVGANLTNGVFTGGGGEGCGCESDSGAFLSLANGSQLSAGGQLVNYDSIQATDSMVTAFGLDNTGSLNIGSGSVADFRGGAFTQLNSGTLDGGYYNIGGSLTYGGERISEIGGYNTAVELVGSGALLHDAGSGIGNGLGGLNTLSGGGSLFLSDGASLTIEPTSGTLTLRDYANLAIADSSLTVTGNLTSQGGEYSGNTNLVLYNGSLTITGNLNQTPDENYYGGAYTDLLSGSSLSIGGTLNQTYAGELSLAEGSTVTANGLNSAGYVAVGQGSVADFRSGGATGGAVDTWAQLDGSTGTLRGGDYSVGGTLYYDPTSGAAGGEIRRLENASIELYDSGQMLYGPNAGILPFSNLSSLDNSGFRLEGGQQALSVLPETGTFLMTNGSGLELQSTFLTVQGGMAVDNSYLDLQDANLTINGSLNHTASLTTLRGDSVLKAEGFFNNGQISVLDISFADFRTVAGANGFANLDSNGSLNGGYYELGGVLKYDASYGVGDIKTLYGAGIYLRRTGAMFYGADGDQHHGLTKIEAITNGSFSLDNASERTLTPGTGTLTLSSSDVNVTGSILNVVGNYNQTYGTTTLGGIHGGGGAPVDVLASALNVTGSYSMTSGTLNLMDNSFLTASGLTNDGGTVQVGVGSIADFRTGGTDTFTNLSGTGILSGGNAGFATYDVTGQFLYDATSSVSGGNILELQNVGITLRDGGTMAYGGAQGGPAGTNGLASLTTLTSSNLYLHNTELTVTPESGTLAINGDSYSNTGLYLFDGSTLNVNGGLSLSASNYIADINVNNSTLNVAGAITQSGNYPNQVAVDNGIVTAGGRYTMNAGSSLYVQNSSSELQNSHLSALGLTNNGGFIGVYEGTVADFRTGLADGFTNVDQNGRLSNGQYVIGGEFRFDSTTGTNGKILTIGTDVNLTLIGEGKMLSGELAGSDALSQLLWNQGSFTLQEASFSLTNQFANVGGSLNINSNSTMSVGAGFDNTSGAVNVSGGSQLDVAGQFQNAGGLLQLLYGSQVTSLGFSNNSGGFLYVDSTSSYDASGGEFTNLNSTSHTLTGGSYTLAGGFNFDGGPIHAIDQGTVIQLLGSNAAMTSGGDNALSELTNLNGGLYLGGASAGFTPTTGTLTIGSTGGLFANYGSDASVIGNLTNSGRIEIFDDSHLNVTGSIDNIHLMQVGVNSTASSAGFRNQGELIVGNSAVLDARGGTFQSFDGTSLTEGTWRIAGQLLFSAPVSGGNILNIGANANVTLSGSGSMFYGSEEPTDAFGALQGIAGHLTLDNGGERTFTPGSETLTVAQTGVFQVGDFYTGANTVNVTGNFANAGNTQVNSRSQMNVSGNVTNSGNLELYQQTYLGTGGKIAVTGAVENQSGGVITVSRGATLAAAGLTNSGTMNLDFQSAVNIGGDVTNNATGTMNVAFTLTATGQFVNHGNVNLGTSAFAYHGGKIDADGDVLNNGTITFVSGENTEIETGGTFTNAATGILIVDGFGYIDANGDTTNEGTVTVNGNLHVTGGNYVQTGGETTVNTGGGLYAANVILQGGTLSGFGTINANVDNQAGNVAPGDPGTMTISGNYTQHALGMMQLQFADEFDYDQIIVYGDVNLNGTLQIDLINGFNPLAGMTFAIMSWSGILTGNFTTFIFPSLAGLSWQQTVGTNDITLSLIASEVPEPGTFGLALLLLAAGIVIARRRRKMALVPVPVKRVR